MSSENTAAAPASASAPAGSRAERREERRGKRREKQPAIKYPFWFGGSASSMAACVTHPLDLGTLPISRLHDRKDMTDKRQVRLQTRSGNAPKNMSGTVVHILRNDGPLGLYTGLSASLLRQLTYSTVRFGIYEDLKTRATTPGREPSPLLLTAMAAASGFVGGIAGNFADVVNVRMQHDAALPPAEQRQYKHAVDGVIRMAREEGALSWFRGWLPNSSRAAAMTASQLASYDTFKRMLLEWTPLGDTLTTHFSASFLAGLVAATVTSPIDVIKTRVMSSANKQGIAGMIGEIYRAEGMMWMFKGWLPSFLRLGPHTICTFVFLEMHRKAYRGVKKVDEQSL